MARERISPTLSSTVSSPPSSALNYRHHFHAGNFADLLKHAVLLALLDRLLADPQPLQVIDTHAGAGLYDLEDAMARKSKEAEAGIGRLMRDADSPEAFDSLKAAVRAANPSGGLRLYPGSPLLAAGRLRTSDRYRGYELRSEDRDALQTVLRARVRPGVKAEAVLGDGYAAPLEATAGRRTVYLIDPPFERGDEYDQVAHGVAALLVIDPRAPVAIWTPLKDLETFDAFLRRLEALKPKALQVVEVRLRPLRNPMKMNGCAMIFLNAPDVSDAASAAAEWIAARCGEAGAEGRLFAL